MSFSFRWPRFSDQFHANAIDMLNSALNKGTKPPVIADKIEVVELEMGTQPPELEIRDIGDLTTDQFRGIFRLSYSGDAHIVLRTKVQANPLNSHDQHDLHRMTGSGGMLDAKKPLVVPMLLRLSHFRLESYVVLVVSRQKGITLVFKTDPLQHVDITSTFDSIAVIQKFIQREIEGQLRQMFREDLPGIIHRLSQQWVKAKVDAPYLVRQHPPPPPPSSTATATTVSDYTPHRTYSVASAPAAAAAAGSSFHHFSSPLRRQISFPPGVDPSSSEPTFPGLENFDPTYGLRPSSLHSGPPRASDFGAFGRLFAPARGLADLAEEASVRDNDEDEADDVDSEFDDDDDDDNNVGDDVDDVPSSYGGRTEWDDDVDDYRVDASVSGHTASAATRTPLNDGHDGGHDGVAYFETLPAVGGGTFSRPRVVHSLSQAQPPPGVLARSTPSSVYAASSTAVGRATPASLARLRMPTASFPSASYPSSSSYNPYFPPMGVAVPGRAHLHPSSALEEQHGGRPYKHGSSSSASSARAGPSSRTPPLYHSPPVTARVDGFGASEPRVAPSGGRGAVVGRGSARAHSDRETRHGGGGGTASGGSSSRTTRTTQSSSIPTPPSPNTHYASRHHRHRRTFSSNSAVPWPHGAEDDDYYDDDEDNEDEDEDGGRYLYMGEFGYDRGSSSRYTPSSDVDGVVAPDNDDGYELQHRHHGHAHLLPPSSPSFSTASSSFSTASSSAPFHHIRKGKSPRRRAAQSSHRPKIALSVAPGEGAGLRLATLSHSNHTLSPYTRVPEHFAVRTARPPPPPPMGAVGLGMGVGLGVRGGGRVVSGGSGSSGGGGGGLGLGLRGAGGEVANGAERGAPVRARRKRVYRLGGGGALPPNGVAERERGTYGNGNGNNEGSVGLGFGSDFEGRAGETRRPRRAVPPPDPSEFELDEMERYFVHQQQHQQHHQQHQHQHQESEVHGGEGQGRCDGRGEDGDDDRGGLRRRVGVRGAS